MDQDSKKQAVARAALEFVSRGDVVGVGTGSTADFFIDALAQMKDRIEGTVASSERSAARLRGHGIRVLELNDLTGLPVYVDGADECTRARHLVKGGGGALTREKIVADAATRFVCVVDESKLVTCLGAFPLPVALGGRPVHRQGFVTDNGNHILDVHGLDIDDPVALESELDHLVGTVCNGLFARRGADTILVGNDSGVEKL